MNYVRVGRGIRGRLDFLPLIVGVTFASAYFVWLFISILYLSFEDRVISKNAVVGLRRAYLSLGFFVVQVGNNITYNAVDVVYCIAQLLTALFLLWGLIDESASKLKAWLISNGMVTGIAVLYFVSVLFGARKSSNSESVAEFWIQLFREIVSFSCFNGFYHYQINSLRNKFQTDSTARTSMEEALNGHRNNEIMDLFNLRCTDAAAVAHAIIHGFKVAAMILYLSHTSINGATRTIVLVQTYAVDLTMSFLGLCFAVVLWRGNHTANNKKIFLWMAFQLVTCMIEYCWLLYIAAIGLSFDMIIMRFLSTFLLVFATIPIVSRRIKEIGRSLEFCEEQNQRGQYFEFEGDVVQLELQDIAPRYI